MPMANVCQSLLQAASHAKFGRERETSVNRYLPRCKWALAEAWAGHSNPKMFLFSLPWGASSHSASLPDEYAMVGGEARTRGCVLPSYTRKVETGLHSYAYEGFHTHP